MAKNLLYNTQTGKSETLPEEHLESAITSGTHAFRKGERVNVVGPDGEAQSVPTEQLSDALSQGFKLENAFQGAVRNYTEDNAGMSGALKAFSGKAASEAAMGLPEIIGEHVADPLATAKWEALKEQHNIATAAGAVTGFGASLTYGGPLFKGATMAGRVAESAVAHQLARAGVERGAESIAKKILAGGAAGAARMGAEGAVIAAPRAITEEMLGDHEAAAESLMWGIGIGAGLGLAGGAMKPVWEKAASKYNGFKEKLIETNAQSLEAQKAAASSPTPGAVTPEIVSDAEAAGLNVGDVKIPLTEGMGKLKPNAKQLAQDADYFGMKPTPGLISANKLVQDTDSALTKSVSSRGARHQENYGTFFDNAEAKIKEAHPSAPVDAYQAGQNVQTKISEGVKTRYAPMAEDYNRLDEIARTVELPDKARVKLYDQLVEESQGAKGRVGGPREKIFRQESEEFLKQNNLFQLDDYISELGERARASEVAGNYKEAEAYRSFADKVDAWSDKEILRQGKALEKDGSEFAHAAAKDFVKERSALDSKYAEFKSFMGELAGVTKVKNRGVMSMVKRIEEMPPEQLFQRVSKSNNYDALRFMQDHFPEAFDSIKDGFKNQLISKHVKDRLQFGSFFTEFDKLPQRVQKLFYAEEEIANINRAKNVFHNLPKDINPSGTARALEFQGMGRDIRELTSVGGILGKVTGEATAAAQEGFIKRVTNVDGILMAENAMKRTADELDRIPSLLAKMGKTTRGVVATTAALGGSRMLSDPLSRLVDESARADKTKDEILKEVSEKAHTFVDNPTRVMDSIARLAEPIGQMGAPATSAIFSQRIHNAGTYLTAQIPRPTQVANPFFKPTFKPSDSQMKTFERKLETILEPFSVLDRLGDGTLTKDHIEALHVVYPRLASIIKERVVEHATSHPEALPYHARLKLSLLLGANLDPSLSPAFIQGLGKTANAREPGAPALGQSTGPQGNPNAQALTLSQRTELKHST